MCGIVGLFLKTEALKGELGRLTAAMLHEMRERGPDSAGFAVYGPPEPGAKLSLLWKSGPPDWAALERRILAEIDPDATLTAVEDHAVLRIGAAGEGGAARDRLLACAPEIAVLSVGRSIEVYKGVGDPDAVAARFGLAERAGGHALAHTRMATESAVTTAGSHPFSTGADSCLVHNGSLSNHNRLRARLSAEGERFQTENDSEVAAGYLAARMRRGEGLKPALEAALGDLDGFYTFAAGAADGFAVLRDPIACKPAILAETDDWAAMSSEYRALAALPGIAQAEIWEPEPARVYSWSRAA